jgi:hypothetical protein
MDTPDPSPADPAAGGAARLSLPGLLRELVGDLPGLVSDRVQLLSLEVGRAGQALAQIVALALAIAVLVSTAWIGLWVGAAALLLASGLAPGWVLAVVLALNLGAAAWAVHRVRQLLPLLGLPATVRRLTLPVPAASESAQGACARS